MKTTLTKEEVKEIDEKIGYISSTLIDHIATIKYNAVEEERGRIEKRISKEIYVPMCEIRENSEYHIGFSACQILYAESKLKFLKSLNTKNND